MCELLFMLFVAIRKQLFRNKTYRKIKVNECCILLYFISEVLSKVVMVVIKIGLSDGTNLLQLK